MHNDELLDFVITEFEHSGWTSSLQVFFSSNFPHFMEEEAVLISLIEALITHSGDDLPLEFEFLQILINEARMQVENDGKFGHSFLTTLNNIINDFITINKLPSHALNMLTTCYARAKVDIPEILAEARIQHMEESAQSHAPALPNMDEMFKTIADEVDGDFYNLFEGIKEMSAGMPIEAIQALVYEVCLLKHTASTAMAAYWLLDSSILIREQAALALLHRVKENRLNGPLIRQLPMLRSWMPGDTARSVIDQVVREIRRRNISSAALARPAKTLHIFATLPDGTGAQSLAIFTKKKIGMVLTKAKFGVKDSFIIPYSDKQEYQSILQHMEDLDAQDVSLETVHHIINEALNDGIENDLAPAHGLIDIVSSFGLEDVRPHSMSPTTWLKFLDPEDMIETMSPQKRGRLINQCEYYDDDFEIMSSWFEDNAVVREIFNSSNSLAQQKKKLTSYLDTRRTFWATRILQAANVIKDAKESADWLPLAATAYALLRGRAIAKTPLMVMIIENTLNSFYSQREEMHEREVILDEFVVPNDPHAVLASAGFTHSNPSWLDGYLMSVVIAPSIIPPQQWVEFLLKEMTIPVNENSASDLVNLAIARYNEIGSDLLELEDIPSFTNLSDDDLVAWSRGFLHAVDMRTAAGKKTPIPKSDQKMIKLMIQISDYSKIDFNPKSIIASWIKASVNS